MLDLRKPTGLFFLLLGVILIGMGMLSPEDRAPMTAVNVNLYAGSAMAIFGGIMLWLAQRRT